MADDSFTLIESGTTRLHFQLVKALEDTSSDEQRTKIVLESLHDARSRLKSASTPASTPAKLASILLTVLHCAEYMPTTDFSFALLPALQLLSTATKWKHVVVAYQMLPFVLDAQETASTSSLMLINTFRNRLINVGSSVERQMHAALALSALTRGFPSGPVVLSSLATPLLELTTHPDALIRKQAVEAMLRTSRYEQDSSEMLDAVLSVVRRSLVSSYCFSEGTALNDKSLEVVAHLEQHAELDPSVLRACLRVVRFCRKQDFIDTEEAMCHTVHILQAINSIDLDIPFPQLQRKISAELCAKLADTRRRLYSNYRRSLAKYNYHGTLCPWLIIACLSTLEEYGYSDFSAKHDVLHAVLVIYTDHCTRKSGSLAICLAAARCIGVLYDGDTDPLWPTIATHIKSQLASSNANRNLAALELIGALAHTLWPKLDVRTPFQLEQADLDRLAYLLGHGDRTVSVRTAKLLFKIKTLPSGRGFYQRVQEDFFGAGDAVVCSDVAPVMRDERWLQAAESFILSTLESVSADEVDSMVHRALHAGLYARQSPERIAAAERFVSSFALRSPPDRLQFLRSFRSTLSSCEHPEDGLLVLARILCDGNCIDATEPEYGDLLATLCLRARDKCDTEVGLAALATFARHRAITFTNIDNPMTIDLDVLAAASSILKLAVLTFKALQRGLENKSTWDELDADTQRMVSRLTKPSMTLLEITQALLTLKDDDEPSFI